MEENKQYTLFVYSENHIGVMGRITNTFTSRNLNIDSLTVSESEVAGVYRFTIVTHATASLMMLMSKRIERQVDVIKAGYFAEEELVTQEVAMYKLSTDVLTDGMEIERLLRKHSGRILAVHKDYFVIEKTGHKVETQALFEDLKVHGVFEFVRSGRVAISKPMVLFQEILQDVEEEAKQTS
ncbi:MAG: acetolactate synthase small subunit [Bacteroidota bacterium]